MLREEEAGPVAGEVSLYMSEPTKETDMQEFIINAGIILAICSPSAVIIAFSICRGDFSESDGRPSPPDELELRRRENETMFRHERRAAHERHFNNLEKRRISASDN